MATFAEFVAARGPALLRTAWLLTGSREDAEDLVQTALVSCYGRYDRIVRDGGSFEAYVRRALARAHISVWRRSRRAAPPSATGPVGPASPADPAAEVETRLVVLEALALLSPRQRQVVVLRFYEDCSVEETARVLGCSVGSVKTHLHRAVQVLRRTPLVDELAKERDVR